MRRLLTLCAVVLALAGCTMPRAERCDLALATRDSAARRCIPVGSSPTLATLDLRYGGLRPALGMTYLANGVPTRVDLLDDEKMTGDAVLARNVAAHEIGHVLGLSHGSCPLCWMYPTQDTGRALIEAPSEDELATARECLVDFDFVPDPSLPAPFIDAMRWAAAAWNRALGRDAVRVRP